MMGEEKELTFAKKVGRKIPYAISDTGVLQQPSHIGSRATSSSS
jgi:hypothetical protein